jgi:hypothetical protein
MRASTKAPSLCRRSSLPSYHTSSPLRENFLRNLKHAFLGDDYVNPQKLLERRYLYYTLLATRLRSLRLESPSHEMDDLVKRATEELDAKGLDRMTNVQLRQEMQVLLMPQVIATFQAFDRVDQCLGIGKTGLVLPPDSPMSVKKSNPFRDFDWIIYRQILESEYEKCEAEIEGHQLDEGSPAPMKEWATNRALFLNRKHGALKSLLDFHGWSSNSTSLPTKGTETTDDFGTNMDMFNDSSMHAIRCYQTINICRSALIKQELGYSVLMLKSLIPDAGRGAFIDGSSLAGSLVAFQPGEMWPKEHLLTTAADVERHFERDDDCLISLRFDDYVLDSRPSPVTVLTQEGTLNPWALGHVANHPPAKTLPNCQSTALDFTERKELFELYRYLPNTYARPPGWKSRFFYSDEILMHGLCLVARRDVCNEELVYDYRLQSDETAAWYSVVQYGDGTDDQPQVVFFRDDWNK